MIIFNGVIRSDGRHTKNEINFNDLCVSYIEDFARFSNKFKGIQFHKIYIYIHLRERGFLHHHK